MGQTTDLRTCTCRSCGLTVTVGHPARQIRTRATAIARQALPWYRRWLARGSRRAIEQRMVEEHYAAGPQRYRELPRRCPGCGAVGSRDLPWWEPGVLYEG